MPFSQTGFAPGAICAFTWVRAATNAAPVNGKDNRQKEPGLQGPIDP